MKKAYITAIILLVLAAGAWVLVPAQNNNNNNNQSQAAPGMCPMHMMMGKMLTETQMVATQDGGVVIRTGTVITKYDANMQPVGEVEIQIDTNAIQKRMMEMCRQCPMCRRMMQQQEPNNNNTENNTPGATPEAQTPGATRPGQGTGTGRTSPNRP